MMSTGAVAIARVDGQVSLVQVVKASESSSHLSVLKYTYFGERSFLSNITSSAPSRIHTRDIIETLPASVQPSGDMLTLSNDVFALYIDRATANQSALEEKYQKAMASGGILLPHAAKILR